jgi:transcriptional regulator with XRE-family HTH domain
MATGDDLTHLFSMRNSPPLPVPGGDAGHLIRHWRSFRRMSQLELALSAEISARHVSFLETGRAQPSLDMVLRLAETLEIPLRDRNGLLAAAGYAPQFRETGLADKALKEAHRALEFILKQAEPYPTIVLDRNFELHRVNQGAKALLKWLLGEMPTETNVLRLVLSQEGLRPYMVNWEEVTGELIRRAQQESLRTAPDAICRQLMAEVLASPGIPESWAHPEYSAPTTPLLTVTYRKGDTELRFFSTFTTFGTPHDITLEELRIESSFPADEETEQVWREICGEGMTEDG